MQKILREKVTREKISRSRHFLLKKRISPDRHLSQGIWKSHGTINFRRELWNVTEPSFSTEKANLVKPSFFAGNSGNLVESLFSAKRQSHRTIVFCREFLKSYGTIIFTRNSRNLLEPSFSPENPNLSEPSFSIGNSGNP